MWISIVGFLWHSLSACACFDHLCHSVQPICFLYIATLVYPKMRFRQVENSMEPVRWCNGHILFIINHNVIFSLLYLDGGFQAKVKVSLFIKHHIEGWQDLWKACHLLELFWCLSWLPLPNIKDMLWGLRLLCLTTPDWRQSRMYERVHERGPCYLESCVFDCQNESRRTRINCFQLPKDRVFFWQSKTLLFSFFFIWSILLLHIRVCKTLSTLCKNGRRLHFKV